MRISLHTFIKKALFDIWTAKERLFKILKENLEDIEKFLGEDLEEYGPFQQGESALLPKNIADILITNGKAEEIE